MTISRWFMILALVVGSGTSQQVDTESSTTLCPSGVPNCRIGSNCWINGTYHTPCPDDYPGDYGDDPDPITQPPG